MIRRYPSFSRVRKYESVRKLVCLLCGGNTRRSFEYRGSGNSVIDVLSDAATSAITKNSAFGDASFTMLDGGSFQLTFTFDPDGNGDKVIMYMRMSVSKTSPDAWEATLIDDEFRVLDSVEVRVPITGIGNDFGMAKQVSMIVSKGVAELLQSMEEYYNEEYPARYADAYSVAERRHIIRMRREYRRPRMF